MKKCGFCGKEFDETVLRADGFPNGIEVATRYVDTGELATPMAICDECLLSIVRQLGENEWLTEEQTEYFRKWL